MWVSTDWALVGRSKIEWVAPDESHRINLVLADVGVEECGDKLLRLVLVEIVTAVKATVNYMKENRKL